jgi:thermitase
MTRKSAIILLLSVFLASLVQAMEIETFNFKGGSARVAKGEIIVKFRPDTYESRKSLLAGGTRAVRVTSIDLGIRGEKKEFEVLRLPAGMSVEEAVALYRAMPEVESVQPNYIRSISVIPNDPQYTNQWALPKISAPSAWDTTRGSSDVIVAVVDTGADYTHPDLAQNIITSFDYDYVNNDNNAMDDNGHGTHVSGIIAAVTNNGIGVAGVSWNTRILPVKVLDASGNGSDSNISNGIKYAADRGAAVINMSFGDTNFPPQGGPILESACDYAFAKGCVLVAASGNGYDTNHDGTITPADTFSMVSYPAAFGTCIAVGASDSTDQRAWFSNYGSSLTLVAPGENIVSTWLSNTYQYEDGTSMATPFVCGAAALILAVAPESSNTKVKWLLYASADDLTTSPASSGYDKYTGYGRLNVAAALNFIAGVPVVAKTSSYPNPFNPKAGDTAYIVIPDALSGTRAVAHIYNLAGELVRILDNPGEIQPFGFAKWDGKNGSGDLVASGIYFYTIETNKGVAKGKLTLIK